MTWEEYLKKNKNIFNRIIRKIKRLFFVKNYHVQSNNLLFKKDYQGLKIYVIEKFKKINIIRNGEDDGYHNYGNDWWFKYNCPLSYSYFNCNQMYPEKYFKIENTGHPDYKKAEIIYEYMTEIYYKLLNRKFKSILELGGGGGAFTKIFQKEKLDFITIEGVESGYQNLIKQGIPKKNLIYSDLRIIENLGKKFDIIMCTEIVEHIEPFFSGRIVEFMIKHSDFIWFSAADRNRPPHFHHINEQDIEVWDNLFAFFGFNVFIKLDGKFDRADRLYMNEKNENVKNILNIFS